MSIFYNFVDFLTPKPFDTDGNLTGKMKLCISTKTPLFIGSGYEEREKDMLYKCFQRYNGNPVIPGSTLKGVLRTVSQAVSYSCTEVEQSLRKDLPYSSGKCSCIVCKTYGKMNLKGMVSFGDFVSCNVQTSIIKIPLQMNPNVEKRDIYYKDGKLRGIKFYRHGDYRLLKNVEIPVEAVEEGNEFTGEIIFRDLHRLQLELLCYSLGLDGSFNLKIGGNKPGFFGSCDIAVKEAIMNGSGFDPYMYARAYGKDDAEIDENKTRLSGILNYNNRITAM